MMYGSGQAGIASSGMDQYTKQPEDSSAVGKLNELLAALEKLLGIAHDHESRISFALRPAGPEPMSPPNVRAAEITPSPIGEIVRDATVRVRFLQSMLAGLTARID